MASPVAELYRAVHGVSVVPLLVALRQRGRRGPDALAGANRGHAAAAARLLGALGWAAAGAPGETALLTRDGLDAVASLPEGLPELERALLAGSDVASSAYAAAAALAEAGWDGAGEPLRQMLDGWLVAPMLVELHERGALAGVGEPHVDDATARVLRAVGLLEAGGRAYSAKGRLFTQQALLFGACVSYAPMMRRMGELLYDDPAAVLAPGPDGEERHVDRVLNVRASGFQHALYFRHVEDAAVRIFDAEPVDAQPRCVVDMGCGDGSLLRRLYAAVRERSLRGRHLEAHPLLMVGSDFSQAALDVTAATLAAADVPHLTMIGDIGDPASLLDGLRARGVDTDDALHVRSFLDHDRPYVPPTRVPGANLAAEEQCAGVHVGPGGELLDPMDIMQSLVEHFERWTLAVARHGLLVLEVHCMDLGHESSSVDESVGVTFDAHQAHSGQLLVDSGSFLRAAATAGLFPVPGHSLRFPQGKPFTRITLHHFKRERQPLELAYRAEPAQPIRSRQQSTDRHEHGTFASIVRSCVSTLLDDDVPMEVPLSDAGLDSMDALSLTEQLQRWTNVRLPGTLLFDYPSMSAIAGFVGDAAGGGGGDGESMRSLVSAKVAALLGDAPEDDRSLAEAGLDSIDSMRLTEQLQESLQVRLPGTLLFDNPTIGSIVACVRALGGGSAPEPILEAPATALEPFDYEDFGRTAELLRRMLTKLRTRETLQSMKGPVTSWERCLGAAEAVHTDMGHAYVPSRFANFFATFNCWENVPDAAMRSFEQLRCMLTWRVYEELSFGSSAEGSHTLYVSFSGGMGNGLHAGVPIPGFTMALPGAGATRCLFVVDPNSSWYLMHPSRENWQGLEFYESLLAELCAPYRRVCFVGSSMGASGALLFAHLADRVVAFNPQVDLERYTAYGCVAVLPTEQKLRFRERLEASARRGCRGGGRVAVHWSMENAEDVFQRGVFDAVAGATVESFGHPYEEHNLPVKLKSQGNELDLILRRLVDELAAG